MGDGAKMSLILPKKHYFSSHEKQRFAHSHRKNQKQNTVANEKSQLTAIKKVSWTAMESHVAAAKVRLGQTNTDWQVEELPDVLGVPSSLYPRLFVRRLYPRECWSSG